MTILFTSRSYNDILSAITISVVRFGISCTLAIVRTGAKSPWKTAYLMFASRTFPQHYFNSLPLRMAGRDMHNS